MSGFFIFFIDPYGVAPAVNPTPGFGITGTDRLLPESDNRTPAWVGGTYFGDGTTWTDLPDEAGIPVTYDHYYERVAAYFRQPFRD